MKKAPSKNQAAFMGAITAETTHELSNIMAVISESAGLIQDIYLLSKDHPLPQPESVKRCLASIDEHVQRGVDLLKSLNRFAHSPDTGQTEVNLPDILRQMIRLCSRMAYRQQIKLQLNPPSITDVIMTDPLVLRMAIYTAVRCCLDTLTATGEIHITLTRQLNTATIHLIPTCDDKQQPSPFPPNPELQKDLTHLMENLSGAARVNMDTGEITLQLPAPPASDSSI